MDNFKATQLWNENVVRFGEFQTTVKRSSLRFHNPKYGINVEIIMLLSRRDI